MLDYIIWNVHPELIEGFRVRWYGLLFAVGFFISYTFLGKIFKKEGLDQKELDNFTFTTFILLIVGLRLGHCLLYEPAEYLKNPIKILYVWEGGLASHGGAIGLLASFMLFAYKSGRSFVWIMSRAVVVIPFTAACVRVGNLMNSEIYGVATNAPWGFVFVRDAVIHATPESFTNMLTQSGIVAQNLHDSLLNFFTMHGQALKQGVAFTQIQEVLITGKFISQEQTSLLIDTCVKQKLITVNHPTQLYEAFVYLITFGILMSYYFIRSAHQKIISNNFILSFALIIIFSARFIIEFIKNDQVGFEQNMTLNMGQWLSVPFILLGIYFLIVFIKEEKQPKNIQV